MLLKTQRNHFFQTLLKLELQPTAFEEAVDSESYRIKYKKPGENLSFYIDYLQKDNITFYCVAKRPGYSNKPEAEASFKFKDWKDVYASFLNWAQDVKREVEASDLWLEATKTAELFAQTADPADDKFNRAELGAVQGQLRMLESGFEAAMLPEEARVKLIKIAQTAADKAETLTKRDWQNWITGSFINAIIGLKLTPAQTQDVLAFIRMAFGGLFLNE
jgi:hypothetical protein